MDSLILHASCVAVNGRGLLLRGPSGAGKSTLALHLMALGAALVADDTTVLLRSGERVIAQCPPAGRGLIEARGIGLLRAVPQQTVPLSHVVDLGPPEARLPPLRHVTLCGVDVPLHRCTGGIESAGALMQLMRGGRHA